MKKIIKAISIVIVFLVILTSVAFAAVVYQYGPNKVTNTETLQFFYSGYGQCNGTYRMGDLVAYQVYIRYRNGMQGDTGRLWSGISSYGANTIKSVSRDYNDTLNPFAPSVIFNYGFNKADYHVAP